MSTERSHKQLGTMPKVQKFRKLEILMRDDPDPPIQTHPVLAWWNSLPPTMITSDMFGLNRDTLQEDFQKDGIQYPLIIAKPADDQQELSTEADIDIEYSSDGAELPPHQLNDGSMIYVADPVLDPLRKTRHTSFGSNPSACSSANTTPGRSPVTMQKVPKSPNRMQNKQSRATSQSMVPNITDEQQTITLSDDEEAAPIRKHLTRSTLRSEWNKHDQDTHRVIARRTSFQPEMINGNGSLNHENSIALADDDIQILDDPYTNFPQTKANIFQSSSQQPHAHNQRPRCRSTVTGSNREPLGHPPIVRQYYGPQFPTIEKATVIREVIPPKRDSNFAVFGPPLLLSDKTSPIKKAKVETSPGVGSLLQALRQAPSSCSASTVSTQAMGVDQSLKELNLPNPEVKQDLIENTANKALSVGLFLRQVKEHHTYPSTKTVSQKKVPEEVSADQPSTSSPPIKKSKGSSSLGIGTFLATIFGNK